MTLLSEALALDTGEAEALMNAVRPLIDTLSAADLRRILLAIHGRWEHCGRPVTMLVAAQCLRACAEDLASEEAACEVQLRGDESLREQFFNASPARSQQIYAEWRDRQERPDEWLCLEGVKGAFRTWALALRVVAGDSLAARPTAPTHLKESGGFIADDLLKAIRAWIGDVAGTEVASRLPFPAYLDWGRARLAEDPGARLPLHPTMPLRFFGSWRHAITEADPVAAARAGLVDIDGEVIRISHYGESGLEREERDQWILLQLGAAVHDLGLGVTRGPDATRPGHSYMSKRRYDSWAKQQRALAANPSVPDLPPHSRTILDRFGSWGHALHLGN